MPRSLYKLPYQHRKLFHIYRMLVLERVLLSAPLHLFRKKYGAFLKTNAFRIFKKSSLIRNVFIAKSALIHDGLFFQRFIIRAHMAGYKFGQYVFTKRLGSYIHKDNKIAKKKIKLLKQRAAAASAKKKKTKK